MRKNGQKCLKKPENQQNGAQKNLNSGLYLKILMPEIKLNNFNVILWDKGKEILYLTPQLPLSLFHARWCHES